MRKSVDTSQCTLIRRGGEVGSSLVIEGGMIAFAKRQRCEGEGDGVSTTALRPGGAA